MKSKIIKSIPVVTCILLILSVACEKAPEPPKNLTFKAECFITTKGSENIKLGGVEVVILDGSMIEFNNFNQSYTNVFAPAQKALNEFVGWEGFVGDMVSQATNKTEQASSSPESSEKLKNDNLTKMRNISDYIAWQEIKEEIPDLPLNVIKVFDKIIDEHKELAETHNELEKEANKICSYNNQLSLIFSQISDYEIKRTRTDADGKLEIKLPICESYIVIAQSQRMVTSEDDPEKYFWILRAERPKSETDVDIEDEVEIKLQMSNYNLSNMNEEKPEESTEKRLILKSPKVTSMARGMSLIRKMLIKEQIRKALN